MGILEQFALTDRVAIVTGAGKGIGAGTAKALAEAGADVVVAARTPEDLERTAATVEAAGDGRWPCPPTCWSGSSSSTSWPRRSRRSGASTSW